MIVTRIYCDVDIYHLSGGDCSDSDDSKCKCHHGYEIIALVCTYTQHTLELEIFQHFIHIGNLGSYLKRFQDGGRGKKLGGEQMPCWHLPPDSHRLQGKNRKKKTKSKTKTTTMTKPIRKTD